MNIPIFGTNKPPKIDPFEGIKKDTLIFEKEFEQKFFRELNEFFQNASLSTHAIFEIIKQMGLELTKKSDFKFYLADIKDRSKFEEAWVILHNNNNVGERLSGDILKLRRAIVKDGPTKFIRCVREIQNMDKKSYIKPRRRKAWWFRRSDIMSVIEYDEKSEMDFVESMKKKVDKILDDLNKYCGYVDDVFDGYIFGVKGDDIIEGHAKAKQKKYKENRDKATNNLNAIKELLNLGKKQLAGKLNQTKESYERIPVYEHNT